MRGTNGPSHAAKLQRSTERKLLLAGYAWKEHSQAWACSCLPGKTACLSISGLFLEVAFKEEHCSSVTYTTTGEIEALLLPCAR